MLLAPIAWNDYLVLLASAVALLLASGRMGAALPLMALPLIDIEWFDLFISTRGDCGTYCVDWCNCGSAPGRVGLVQLHYCCASSPARHRSAAAGGAATAWDQEERMALFKDQRARSLPRRLD